MSRPDFTRSAQVRSLVVRHAPVRRAFFAYLAMNERRRGRDEARNEWRKSGLRRSLQLSPVWMGEAGRGVSNAVGESGAPGHAGCGNPAAGHQPLCAAVAPSVSEGVWLAARAAGGG